MQNSPTTIPSPPPLLLPPPPRSAGEITVLFPPPPQPFASAPSSVFQITVLPAPPVLPTPQFADSSSSVNLSPLEFLLALVAVVTIPALIYTFIFAFRFPSFSRRQRSAGGAYGEPSIASDLSHHNDVEIGGASEVAVVKYQKEEHAAEIGGECPVCLSVFADGEEVRKLSVCKHSFHASCIDLWLSNHSNCPICRATIITAAGDAGIKRSGSTRDGDLQQGPHGGSDLV